MPTAARATTSSRTARCCRPRWKPSSGACIIDVGHGGGSFDYTVAEPAIEQGLTPDTISSDIHAVSGNTPGKPYLPWVMSKFLNLGFSLEQVVAMATVERPRA